MSTRSTAASKKLSGGQRKRVSIALELLANPSLFFLDEPTSGLDPSLDRKMMYLLRKLADKGHTIILVTHATNNLSACDYVCFLAPGGHLAYFGPPERAKAYFGKDDFAEIYSVLEPTEDNAFVSQEAEVRFRASNDYREYIARPLKEGQEHADGISSPTSAKGEGKEKRRQKRQRPKSGNLLEQFFFLCMRSIELLKNNKTNLAILLLQAPLVAVLLMLLVRYEIGSGIFDANKIVQCRPQIPTSSGLLTLPRTTDPTQLVDCTHVVNFLKTDFKGEQYAQQKGGTNQALQDFIAPSIDGGDAQRVIFLVSFFAVMFGVINASREIVKEDAIYPLKDWFTMIMATVAPTRWAAVALGSSLGLHSDKIDGGKLFGDDPT